jgi:hypothetical protein
VDGRFVSVTALIALASLTSTSGAAQTPRTNAKTDAASKAWSPPRTSDGQPDLQGVWDFRTITPLERPDVFAGKEVLTDEEVADVEQQKARFDAADPKDRRDVNPGFSTSRNLTDRVDEQAYNNNIQIVQAPGYVVILNEMIHDVRVMERFTRAGPETLNYEFTVSDPKSYARP